MAGETYAKGFMDKCAELGVDPGALLKRAGLYGAMAGVGNTMRNAAGFVGDTVDRGRNWVRNKVEAFGDAMGNRWAQYQAAHPRALTPREQMDRLRMQVGYQNRVLRGYRNFHGVPHSDVRIPNGIGPTGPADLLERGVDAAGRVARAVGRGGSPAPRLPVRGLQPPVLGGAGIGVLGGTRLPWPITGGTRGLRQ